MEDDRRHYSPQISCHSQAVNPAGQKDWLGTRTPGSARSPGEGQTRPGMAETLHRAGSASHPAKLTHDCWMLAMF